MKDKRAEEVVKIFKDAGMTIEPGAHFSVKGQIAQLLNGSEALQAECEKLKSEQDHLRDYSAALKHMDLPCLVLGAWRYWMYRTTISSYAFLKYELPAAWPHLPENVRTVIVRDIQSDLDIAPEHCPVPAENIPLLEAILMMASMPKTYQR